MTSKFMILVLAGVCEVFAQAAAGAEMWSGTLQNTGAVPMISYGWVSATAASAPAHVFPEAVAQNIEAAVSRSPEVVTNTRALAIASEGAGSAFGSAGVNSGLRISATSAFAVAPNATKTLPIFATVPANTPMSGAAADIFATGTETDLMDMLRAAHSRPDENDAGVITSGTRRPFIPAMRVTKGASQPKPLEDTAAADVELRSIVAQQKTIFSKAEAAGDALVSEDLQAQLQQLAQRYDKLLRVYPNYVAGLVAYGQLLMQAGMRKEGAALMYEANTLDGTIPLVKNELGNYCAESGFPIDAYVLYTSAIALAPNEPLYYYQLGALLTEARDIFLTETPGMWTRGKIDEAMQAAFQQAMELAPGDWRYAYRYGLSFYDLETKQWFAALQFWQAFEKKLKPGLEQQVARLHEAKVLIELGRAGEAQQLLDTVTDEHLAAQKMPVTRALAELKKK